MHLASETRPQVRRDRLLRLSDVENIVGLRKTTIYTLMQRGEFPRAVRTTSRSVAWSEQAVLGWVQERIADAQASSAKVEELAA